MSDDGYHLPIEEIVARNADYDYARAERAEAAIERVRALLVDEFGHSIHDSKRITLRELRAALDGTDNTGGTDG